MRTCSANDIGRNGWNSYALWALEMNPLNSSISDSEYLILDPKLIVPSEVRLELIAMNSR